MSDFIDKSEVEDCHDLELELRVNDEVRQAANTNMMIFSVPRLIADISKYLTLHEGDLIYTGTPEGVGPCSPGDHIHCTLKKPNCEESLLEIDIDVEK